MTQHIWSPNWEKVPGSASAPWVRLQQLQFRAPAHNPTNWHHHHPVSKLHLWFPVYAVCFVMEAWNVVKPGAWLARPPPGAQPFQGLSPVLSLVLKPCAHSRQSGHSQWGQCPGRLEAGSGICSALSLKPKQDSLFNFPVRAFPACSRRWRSWALSTQQPWLGARPQPSLVHGRRLIVSTMNEWITGWMGGWMDWWIETDWSTDEWMESVVFTV